MFVLDHQSPKWQPLRSLCILLLLLGPTAAWAQEQLQTSFSTGEPEGNLPVEYEQAEFETEGEQSHLAIQPGGSISATFDTSGHWGEVIAEFVGRTSGTVVFSVAVNHETVEEAIQFNFDVYTSTGHNISRKIVPGENVVTFAVTDSSQGDLWLREVRIDTGTRQPPWMPWAKLVVLIILSFALCRWGIFRLLWMGGRGMDPIWATRVSIILLAVAWFFSYAYAFGGMANIDITIGVGSGIVILMLVALGFTRV